jgi:integrase
MGTVYNRGTKHAPKWWVGYKDVDGEWKYVPSAQPTKEQAKRFLSQVESNVAAGRAGIEQTDSSSKTCGSLLDEWKKTLTNRNAADDKYRLEKHVRPKFGTTRARAITLGAVMAWVDEQRAGTAPVAERACKAKLPLRDLPEGHKRPGPKPKARPAKPARTKPARLSDASIRHNLNLLSRFLGWCVERGHAAHNVVRDIPQGRRPTQSVKRDVPWLDDDAMVRRLMRALPEPICLMFYLANRSGLRTGEAVGLRISDLAFLDEGVLRLRYSYSGPLKEDKHARGKVKWAPAPTDARDVLAAHLARRELQGAGPEALVFELDGAPVSKMRVHRAWTDAAAACSVALTWYQATRHSFASRNMSRGASLDEVSAAMGHSSPVVTRRYYDHFIRKGFSPGLRAGLGADPPGAAPVIQLRSRRRK